MKKNVHCMTNVPGDLVPAGMKFSKDSFGNQTNQEKEMQKAWERFERKQEMKRLHKIHCVQGKTNGKL